MAYNWTDLLDKLFQVFWQGIDKTIDAFIEFLTGFADAIFTYGSTATNGYLYLLLFTVIIIIGFVWAGRSKVLRRF